MPKFHYKVELTDGSIAKRSSERIYTHLIEISPRPLKAFVEDMDKDIASYQESLVEFTDDYITETVAKHINDCRKRGIPEDQIISIAESRHKSLVMWREGIEMRLKDSIQMRDVAIADGHPTVGNYFASNWCGSLALAEKKLNSADVRYWTNKGRTARIVPTQSANEDPIYL